MSAFYTIGELRKRLKAVAPASLDFADLLNEIGARAYSIGRWPDSETELTVAAADKRKVTTTGDEAYGLWFAYVSADLYDGVIAAKVDGYGNYDIRPLAATYAESNAYWAGFVDYGIVDENNERRYRMPEGVTDQNRVTFLVKKRWQNVYQDSDVIPIRPFAAIKAGVLAARYEADNAIAEAERKWEEFEQLLIRDDKQFTGVKNLKMRFRMGGTKNPTSFR